MFPWSMSRSVWNTNLHTVEKAAVKATAIAATEQESPQEVTVQVEVTSTVVLAISGNIR